MRPSKKGLSERVLLGGPKVHTFPIAPQQNSHHQTPHHPFDAFLARLRLLKQGHAALLATLSKDLHLDAAVGFLQAHLEENQHLG